MSLSTSELWSAALSLIRTRLSEQQFDTWFQALGCVDGPTGQDVVLEVPNRFLSDWLTNHYLDMINRCLSEAAGRKVSAAICVRGGHSQFERPYLSSPRATWHASRNRGVPLNKNFVFETFVVAPCNALAHAAAVAIAEAPGKSYNPLFLHSAVGMGKTHLLQACCHQIQTSNPHLNILSLSCENFVNEFIASVERGELENFRYSYRHVDVLAIDDIHFLANKERTQEEFFHTFNTLYHSQKQIILSSDSPPREIPSLEERLVTRFKWGLVAKIEPPELETRIAIVHMKVKLLNRKIPRDVVEYIAGNVTTSIRELEGAVVRSLGISALTDRPLDLKLVRETLQETKVPAPRVGITDIQAVVAEHFNLKVTDLQGKRRLKSIAFPRQICMYFAKELTSLSLVEIGGHFGGRDHTTVLYAIDKIKKSIEKDASLVETISTLRRDIVTQ